MSDFIARAAAAIRGGSRTAGLGESDTSSSAEKPKLAVTEGADLACRADSALVEALTWAIGVKPAKPTAQQMKKLIRGIATRVNAGLLKPGVGIWRTHVTKFRQTKPGRKLRRALKGFYRDLAAKLKRGKDFIAVAAWIEWQFDARIHPLADGCGRSTKVLVAWVLNRAGFDKLPNYPSRTIYYQMVVRSLSEWTAYYRTLLA